MVANIEIARRNKAAFTLIELLVVIAIIAILAAILFPVFAKAREKARQTACMSNMKQLGLATIQYVQDYDEFYYSHRLKNDPNPLCTAQGGPDTCAATGTGAQITGDATNRTSWAQLLQPYLKSYAVFLCPSNPTGWVGVDPIAEECGGQDASSGNNSGCGGRSYGAENSYGHNDMFMSPAGNPTSFGTLLPIASSQVQRPSSTALIMDAEYYGVAPDLQNQSGYLKTYGGQYNPAGDLAWMGNQSNPAGQYENYWKNIGNGKWGYDLNTSGTWLGTGSTGNKTDDAGVDMTQQGPNRHTGFVNVVFADGHAKAIRYEILVGDICYWAIDGPLTVNGTAYTLSNHAFCN